MGQGHGANGGGGVGEAAVDAGDDVRDREGEVGGC